MSAWKTPTLADIASFARDIIEPHKILTGSIYVGLENIESGGRFLNVKSVVNGELASSKFVFTDRHLLYGKLRPYLAKIACPEFEGVCSTDILPILPGPNADRKYLAYFLRQPDMVELASSRSAGANLPRLSPKVLGEFEIPLPPLPEQQRIAAILDAADALREKRRQAIAKLDGLVQAVFVEMFGDPSARNQRWPIATIADVCKSRLGKMLDEKQQSGQHARMYLRNANVQWHRFNLTDVNEMDFDERDREKFRLVPGDLLVCEGGEPGRCAIWNGEIEECYYQKALHRIRPDRSRLDVQYMAHLFWHLARRGGFSDQITSATIAHLTGEKLKAMKIPVPPLEIQEQFANTVSTINRVKTTQQASLAHLNTLFLSLQQRAFRGEL
jgi:type I restriction enzyme S subunit